MRGNQCGGDPACNSSFIALLHRQNTILSENTNCSLCLKRKLVNLRENTTAMFVKFSERTFQEAGQFSKVDKRQSIRKWILVIFI